MSNRELKPSNPGLVTKKSKELVNFPSPFPSYTFQGDVSVASQNPTKTSATPAATPNIHAGMVSGGTGNVNV